MDGGDRLAAFRNDGLPRCNVFRAQGRGADRDTAVALSGRSVPLGAARDGAVFHRTGRRYECGGVSGSLRGGGTETRDAT